MDQRTSLLASQKETLNTSEQVEGFKTAIFGFRLPLNQRLAASWVGVPRSSSVKELWVLTVGPWKCQAFLMLKPITIPHLVIQQTD